MVKGDLSIAIPFASYGSRTVIAFLPQQGRPQRRPQGRSPILFFPGHPTQAAAFRALPPAQCPETACGRSRLGRCRSLLQLVRQTPAHLRGMGKSGQGNRRPDMALGEQGRRDGLQRQGSGIFCTGSGRQLPEKRQPVWGG